MMVPHNAQAAAGLEYDDSEITVMESAGVQRADPNVKKLKA